MNLQGIVKISWRNVLSLGPRRFGLLLTVMLAFFVFAVGSLVLSAAENGLSRSYRYSMTGDASLSAHSDSPFGIMGMEVPFIGALERVPLLHFDTAVLDSLLESGMLNAYQALLAGPAALGGEGSPGGEGSTGESPRPAWLFGVDFKSYFTMMDGLVLTKGRFPLEGERAIMLNEEAIGDFLINGRQLEPGDTVLLTTALGGAFVIRELVLTGFYAYPARDLTHSKIVLADYTTASELFGTSMSTDPETAIDDGLQSLLDADLDDLFATDPAEPSAVPLPEPAQEALDSHGLSTHFLLLDTAEGISPAQLKQSLESLGVPTDQLLIRNWRDTAGGLAQITWFISIVFSLGILLIIAVIMFVVVNSLTLEVSERSFEIGTIRALGGQKMHVVMMFTLESFLTVGSAGIAGIVLGVFFVQILTGFNIPIDNPLLSSLFGANTLTVPLDPVVLIQQVSFALGTSILTALYPVMRAVGIPPILAMRRT